VAKRTIYVISEETRYWTNIFEVGVHDDDVQIEEVLFNFDTKHNDALTVDEVEGQIAQIEQVLAEYPTDRYAEQLRWMIAERREWIARKQENARQMAERAAADEAARVEAARELLRSRGEI
jgi:hypothetical protein